jgi:predicted PurR-regulated permease PerM
MGLFLFVLLTIFRVPNAIAIAALGAFGDVIPYVGVLLTIAPAFLAALGKGVGTAVIVGCACAFYQEFENRVIVPRIYGRVLRLPSAAVLLALLVGGVLGGVVGSILALPFAAALRMLVTELRVELPGDDTPDEDLREQDQRVEETYQALSAGASAQEAAAIAVELAAERQHEVVQQTDEPVITTGEKDRS